MLVSRIFSCSYNVFYPVKDELYCLSHISLDSYVCKCVQFDSLQNDNILDQTNLKGFADDKINVTEKEKFVLERAENTAEKE